MLKRGKSLKTGTRRSKRLKTESPDTSPPPDTDLTKTRRTDPDSSDDGRLDGITGLGGLGGLGGLSGSGGLGGRTGPLTTDLGRTGIGSDGLGLGADTGADDGRDRDTRTTGVSGPTTSAPATGGAPATGPAGGASGGTAPLPFSGTLTVQAHRLPTGATVRLRPRIELAGADGGKTVKSILISRLQRTPSPFPGRMGDHTVAWQTVVDAVRASLHGRPVADAVQALRALQNAVWLGGTSAGLRQLGRLDREDIIRRVPLLEDAAHRVHLHCERAYAATDPGVATRELALAVAQHLTYLNYLPFATVPAASDRGSKGSGEGTFRNVLVEYEHQTATARKAAREAAATRAAEIVAAGGTPPPPAPAPAATPAEVSRLRTAVWRMFAFDAALRVAHVEYVLNPAAALEAGRQYGTLTAVQDQLNVMLSLIAEKVPMTYDAAEGVDQAAKNAKAVASEKNVFHAIYRAANLLEQKSGALRNNLGQVSKGGITTVRANAARKEMDSTLYTNALADAREVAESVAKIGTDAPAHAADLLSYLLYKHLRAVATAYPRSLLASGFPAPTGTTLGADVAAAVAVQLDSAIRAEFALFFKTGTPAKLAPLLAEVRSRLGAMPGIPMADDPGDWAADAAGTDLVVEYTDQVDAPLRINGRAPAPQGVAGMGCHTTAWVIESQHASAIVHTALRTRKEPVEALRAAVRTDLTSSLIRLSDVLPIDQLEGRQLIELFGEAFTVLTTTDVATAATAYLSFRNLLPYATVNEGDRAGHAERQDGGLKETFDEGALEEAAEIKQQELLDSAEDENKEENEEESKGDDDGGGESAEEPPLTLSQRLNDSAALLRAEFDARWTTDSDIGTAVDLVYQDLVDMAMALLKPTADELKEVGASAVERITTVRRAEHEKVWKAVMSYRRRIGLTTG
ncbi:hypothetical protein Misp01_22340 [Microtetraspora sp. NBRC 13810]|uniref:hypothetical protein n=1 Tax=Microtetraspora sp. NBRC 13810 TaxID=3030990 RepID=UPI0024A2BFA7|nr:hypothetical protein [Microtetraspora sp. NBRC 13810]GLW07104.1 hypothetical protein Misp01_22340 [Microtetraspora sp. NBRC 13810]